MQTQTAAENTSRDFKCPCGKTYLSYPALFTHIKFKHDGKAPGQIEKPIREAKPRGRPSHSQRKLRDQNDEDSKSTDNTIKDVFVNCTEAYTEEYQKLFAYVKEILFPEQIREQIWEQVSSFKEYQKFIDKSKGFESKDEKGYVNVGMGLTQFLRDVSLKCVNWRFQQILILFMLLLQYTIDEQNQASLIFTQPVEMLIQYMNPFMNDHIEDYAQYLSINNLWALDKNNIKKIFLCFYNWLKLKSYTNFCITLIE